MGQRETPAEISVRDVNCGLCTGRSLLKPDPTLYSHCGISGCMDLETDHRYEGSTWRCSGHLSEVLDLLLGCDIFLNMLLDSSGCVLMTVVEHS